MAKARAKVNAKGDEAKGGVHHMQMRAARNRQEACGIEATPEKSNQASSDLRCLCSAPSRATPCSHAVPTPPLRLLLHVRPQRALFAHACKSACLYVRAWVCVDVVVCTYMYARADARNHV